MKKIKNQEDNRIPPAYTLRSFIQTTLQNTFRIRGYRIPFVQYLMEYPIEYLKECPVEYPVVEHLTDDRLC